LGGFSEIKDLKAGISLKKGLQFHEILYYYVVK